MVHNVVLSILREDKDPRCGKPRSFVDLNGRGDNIFFNYYGPRIEISCNCISALRVKTCSNCAKYQDLISDRTLWENVRWIKGNECSQYKSMSAHLPCPYFLK